jgi:hypothetical protein
MMSHVKMIMNGQCQVGVNNPQSDNVTVVLYWDLNLQFSFACNREALHEHAGVSLKVSQA